MDKDICRRLNKLWHSRLPEINSLNWSGDKIGCYGFFYEGECYAVGIWSNPISSNFNDKPIMELRRYAIKESAPDNTGSWGLSIMRKLLKNKFPELEAVISYQDTEVHNGTIYKADNWYKDNHYEFDGTGWENRPNRTNHSEADKIRWRYDLE